MKVNRYYVGGLANGNDNRKIEFEDGSVVI